MERRQTTDDPGQAPPPSQVGDGFFREVNDRIMELGERFGVHEDRLELICECDDPACTERIGIAHAAFTELRDRSGLHLVTAGHAHSGRIVARGDGYVVVAD